MHACMHMYMYACIYAHAYMHVWMDGYDEIGKDAYALSIYVVGAARATYYDRWQDSCQKMLWAPPSSRRK